MIVLTVAVAALSCALCAQTWFAAKERREHRQQMTSVYERAFRATFARSGLEFEQMQGIEKVAEARAQAYGRQRERTEPEPMPIGLTGD